MTAAEVAEFEGNEFYREAVALRRWDDEAKIPGLATRGLEEYRAMVDAAGKK
jgi:predicted HD phosphohydrolase